MSEEVCRLCLQQVLELASVFQYKSGVLVTELIETIIPEIKIDRNDSLSKQICVTCLSIILSACDLR